ncbi:LmbE-like protein [Kaistia algarum]|uniref:PIG-L deacetylase family protein n=1 Tax=Kaistia algarum TaxID=2083279 RepID=UPI000CE843B9|nr:PIG-L family deacetylase [Kaistia algarum]MCX5516477.1 PIG-L family deacetylase [Kaistia algarum]PPE78407.1 LmbE-like protein [Kaistia algarum]
MIDERIYSGKAMLVVGAHAFDAEVIAGPLAAQAAKRGVAVTFLHLTMGEQGHTSLAPAAYAQQKRVEAGRFAARLGIEWRDLGYPDAFLPDDDEVALKIADVIRDVRPDTIVTHWQGSWHKDHRAAANATKTAVLYAALPTLQREHPAFSPSLLLFGENWEDDEGFAPAHLVDVSEGFDTWREAIVEYELARGLSSFPYVDYYSSLYRLRGCLNGTTYAQAFATTSHSFNAGGGLFNGPRRASGCGCGGHE